MKSPINSRTTVALSVFSPRRSSRVAGLGRVGDDVLASVIAEEMARYDQWDAEDRARARSVPPECSHGECSHG
jgi:hypothetical protein